MPKITNIIEFIAAEHQNQLVSFTHLGKELGSLQALDEIYQEIRQPFSIDKKKLEHFVITAMYLQAHNEFYIAASQFFRSHWGKAFLSLRIAIDASFNAYYFVRNPQDVEAFLDEEHALQRQVFWRIKAFMGQNLEIFPLAANLIKVHELTSNVSAHSSLASIVHKYKERPPDGSGPGEMGMNYFDELEPENFLFYYFSLLKGFFLVFSLFHEAFFKNELKIIVPARDKKIMDFEKHIELKHKQYPFKKSA